jgi:histidyl-tRNA synthetase
MNLGATTSSAPARGMRDFMPAEVALRDWATSKILAVYQKFGFTRIETPAVENIAQLRRGEGGENLQLIFEILKRGDKLDKVLSGQPLEKDELADLGLRFDLTVPLVRFYSANQSNLPNPFKAIQIGSVWRAESPQQGRYRQFTQCDIDTFGIKSEFAEMELIEATSEALLSLGFESFTIHLNDRRVLSALAESCGFESSRHDNVFIQIDKLDKIGIAGVEKELGENGHAPRAVAAIVERLKLFQGRDLKASNIEELVGDNCPSEVVAALTKVIEGIRAVSQGKYAIVFDPTLVRGMGYYTGQIFEIKVDGYSSSVGGGGRYDKMVGKMTGRDVPGVGFSIGFERIISILLEKNVKPEASGAKIAIIYDPERDQLSSLFEGAKKLRDAGNLVSVLPRRKEMRKQIDALIQQGFTEYASWKSEGELELKPLSSS